MHELPEPKLKGLIIEETGAEEGATSVTYIIGAVKSLKAFADFKRTEDQNKPSASTEIVTPEVEISGGTQTHDRLNLKQQTGGLGLNLSSTINLNLPATSDIAVFNAIFKSLKENLLKDSDE